MSQPAMESQNDAALQGVTVLDASRVLAGPYCTMLLGDLGAEVIKIERPPGGDDTRAWGPPYLGDPGLGMSAYYLSVNRGKRSLCLDLKDASGRELFLALARRADVLVENFAPGVAARLGLSAETLASVNPRLIHCSITAFGSEAGPAYDLVIQGMSGLMSISGEADGPPAKMGVAITDVIAGLQATSAVLAALVSRGRTGRGDHISVGLLGSAVASLVNIGQAYLVSGTPPVRWGNAHPQIVPYQVFATADGYLTVAAGNDKLFGRLCEVLDRADLAADPRFVTNPQRVAHRAALIAILDSDFATKSTREWLALLRSAEIPSGPVAGLVELFGGPQPPPGVKMLELQTASGAGYRTVGPAVEMGGLTRRPSAAPLVGEHTDQVLRELGLDDERVVQLRSDGVIR